LSPLLFKVPRVVRYRNAIMYTLENLPVTVTWIQNLNAPEAIEQIRFLGLNPAETLAENRVILSNFVKQRRNVPSSVQQNTPTSTPTSENNDSESNVSPFLQSIENSTAPVLNTPITQENSVRPNFSDNVSSIFQPQSSSSPVFTFSQIDNNLRVTPSVSVVQDTFQVGLHSSQFNNRPIPLTTASGLGNATSALPSQNDPRLSSGLGSTFPPAKAPDSQQPDQLTVLLQNIHKNTLETIQTCLQSVRPHKSPCDTIVKDLCKALPLVSGTDIYQLLDMLKQLCHILELGLVTEQQVIQLALSRTEGPLRTVWAEAISANVSWETLRGAIIENFFPVRVLRSITNELLYRIQRPNESLRDYISDLQQTAALLVPHLSESETVQVIIQGINPPTRAHLSMQAVPCNFFELNQLACISAERSIVDREYSSLYGYQNFAHRNTLPPNNQFYYPVQPRPIQNQYRPRNNYNNYNQTHIRPTANSSHNYQNMRRPNYFFHDHQRQYRPHNNTNPHQWRQSRQFDNPQYRQHRPDNNHQNFQQQNAPRINNVFQNVQPVPYQQDNRNYQTERDVQPFNGQLN